MPAEPESAEQEPFLVRRAAVILGLTIALAALVTALGIFAGAPWESEYQSTAGLSGPERINAQQANSQTKRNNVDITLRLALGIGAVGGALVGFGRFELSRREQKRADRQFQLAQDQFKQSELQFLAGQDRDSELQKREAARQMAERFVSAIRLIASQEDAAVIGGLYSLEGIFLESAGYHQRVIDVVCARIRVLPERAGLSGDKEASASAAPPVPEVLRVALDVLMRCRALHPDVAVDLSSARLQGAHLEGAHLAGAHLEGVHLAGARLLGAHLEGARLEVGDMRKAYLYQAILTEAHLEWANLNDAHLDGAHLEGAYLEEACLQRAHLGWTHLGSASLFRAHLEGAYLHAADLPGAYLEGAHMERVVLYRANLRGANLRGAHMEGSRLNGAYLEGANLEGAHLEGVIYDEDTVWPEGFTPPPALTRRLARHRLPRTSEGFGHDLK